MEKGQWAELRAEWLVITQKPSPIVVCTDSWAVNQDLTLWLPTWCHDNWMVGHQPLWGQELLQDLWASGQTKTVIVYHVTGHLPWHPQGMMK